mgnify:FL=1
MIEQNHVRFLNLFHLKVSFVFSSLSEKQRPTFSLQSIVRTKSRVNHRTILFCYIYFFCYMFIF